MITMSCINNTVLKTEFSSNMEIRTHKFVKMGNKSKYKILPNVFKLYSYLVVNTWYKVARLHMKYHVFIHLSEKISKFNIRER